MASGVGSMMHLFINASGANAGGGLTYLANVLPHLSHSGVRTTVAVSPGLSVPNSAADELVKYVRIANGGSAARRFWLEQTELPGLIRNCGADVLLSAGNFALRKSPVPQILLSRNSLYTSPAFYRDLVARGEYRMWGENRIKGMLARRSISWADRTIAPSAAFAGDLERWAGRPVVALHHGFDPDLFAASREPLPEDLSRKLDSPAGTLRVLLVSHYNYYRNFETVFRALAKFNEQGGTQDIRLFLTCELKKSKTPGGYDPESAARLIDHLGIRDQIVEVGTVPYEQLHHVYRACDVFVTAAYTETFAHPLVEAMSCGLPGVASDLPVHREICGEAALYFPRFSPQDLASQLLRLAASGPLRRALAHAGKARSQAFSWRSHVEQLLRIAQELLGAAAPSSASSHAMSAA